MRRAWLGFAAIILVVLAAVAGCEDEEQQQPASTQPAGPSQPQFQRLKLATQPATLPMPPPDWKPSTEPGFSTTQPSTRSASTEAASSSQASDPLENPESAVRRFLELCGRKDLPDFQTMRSMIVEPPSDVELAPILDRIRRRLLRGAIWEIVQTHSRGPAAVVLYKTTYRGRSQVGAITLLQGHDDRWKVIVSDLSPVRYTPGEKEAMAQEAAWAQEQLAELNAALATQPAASQPTTTQPATKPTQ